jgi:hypothetical protein
MSKGTETMEAETELREAFEEQTDLVDRLLSAIERAEEDIGGETAITVIGLLGPSYERSRAALARATGATS